MRLFSNTSDLSKAIPPELLCRPLRYLQNDLLENLPEKRQQKTSCSSLQEVSLLYVTRFELATFWSVARRSIQLSYTYTSLRSTCFATKITIPKFSTFVNAFSPFFRLSFKCPTSDRMAENVRIRGLVRPRCLRAYSASLAPLGPRTERHVLPSGRKAISKLTKSALIGQLRQDPSLAGK